MAATWLAPWIGADGGNGGTTLPFVSVLSGQVAIVASDLTTPAKLTAAAGVASTDVVTVGQLTGFATLATGSVNQVVLGNASLSPVGNLFIGDGTSTDGQVQIATANFLGTQIAAFSAFKNTGDGNGVASLASVGGVGILTLGTSGALAGGVTLTATSNTAATAGGAWTFSSAIVASGGLTLSGTTSQYIRGDGSAATTATSLPPNGSAGGSLTGTYPNPTLAATTVTANPYGSASAVATFTVGADGRLTAASSTAIAIASAAVSGLTGFATLATGTVNQVVMGNASLSSIGNFVLGDGTSTDGMWKIAVANIGVPFSTAGLYNVTTDTQPIAYFIQNNGKGGWALGTTGGSTAAGVTMNATANAAATQAGIITYSSSPVVPAPSATGQAVRWDGLPRTLYTHFADQGNGADTSEDTLYTDNLAAGQLLTNGDVIEFTYAGTYDSSTAGTKRLRFYFGGTVVVDSTAVAGTAAGSWQIVVTVMRDSSTSVRVSGAYQATGISAANVALASATFTKVTGLTLSNAQTVKITGTSGTTATANRMVASEAVAVYQPAAL